ncbi:MAG TPA: glycosyltransferase domain-containing protein [Chitinophagaceae bacterium]|nr:glycosyltransferase domain-containing protein [Chitinophagaceae bacterium]
MKVIYTALFGKYEELKEPTLITPGWHYICFTDQPLKSHIWEIVPIPVIDMEARRLARFYKIMKWKAWEQSFWIDASFTINTNLDHWWAKYFKKGFSAAKHPIRNCLYEEGMHCINTGRSPEGIALQLERYKTSMHPKNSGLITSGLIMRENTPAVIALCNAWWSELNQGSLRDQISFARISYNSNMVHIYDWDYRNNNHFIYKKHFHLR